MKTLAVENEDLRRVLTSGCDERIYTSPETGRNKYFLDPLNFEDLFFRGSCTCGTLTPLSKPIAESNMSRFEKGKDEVESWAREQRERIQSLIHSPVDYEVFFAPSGSDLVYYPILFQRMLSSKPVLNILSCPEELGSGSLKAAEGKYYSNFGPFGDRLEIGQSISSKMATEVISFAARSKEGAILHRGDAIRETIEEHPERAIVANLVFGSKSGIKDDLDVIDPNLPVLWTVDLCQFRADEELIASLLSKNAMVLITGSKFYNSPPFCGALLVPKTISDSLLDKDPSPFSEMSSLLAKTDIPERFQHIREQLPHDNNDGLRLRWECAITEMEAYAKWPRLEANQAIEKWNQTISKRLRSSDLFELMPGQEHTNRSIISFRVRKGDLYLNHKELGQLFKLITHRDFSDRFSFKHLFIGQPVRYGDRSFIRFALGSFAVRQFLTGDITWENEVEMIEAIEEVIREGSWS